MIVITTPTGRVGGQLLALLARGDQPVRVIVRDPSRMPANLAERVETVVGSHDDPSVLERALTGADQVFWLVPPNPTAVDPIEHYLAFARPAADAIRRLGVTRVVGVSSLDYGDNDAGLLTAAFRMEDAINATGVDRRWLRMPYYMENVLDQAGSLTEHGAFFGANDPDRELALVSTRDIAARAAELLADQSWSEKADVALVSPDALTPNEMAQTVSEVLGTPKAYQHTAESDFRSLVIGQGASEGWAGGLIDMSRAQNRGLYDAEANLQRGSAPTSFRTWCEDILRPAIG